MGLLSADIQVCTTLRVMETHLVREREVTWVPVGEEALGGCWRSMGGQQTGVRTSAAVTGSSRPPAGLEVPTSRREDGSSPAVSLIPKVNFDQFCLDFCCGPSLKQTTTPERTNSPGSSALSVCVRGTGSGTWYIWMGPIWWDRNVLLSPGFG